MGQLVGTHQHQKIPNPSRKVLPIQHEYNPKYNYFSISQKETITTNNTKISAFTFLSMKHIDSITFIFNNINHQIRILNLPIVMTFLSIQVQEDLQFQFFLLQLINLQYVCLYHFLYKLSYGTVQKILKIIIHILQKKWSLNPKLKHIYLHVLFFCVFHYLLLLVLVQATTSNIFISYIHDSHQISLENIFQHSI